MADPIQWGIYANAMNPVAESIGKIGESMKTRRIGELIAGQDFSTTEGALAAAKTLFQNGMQKEGMTLAQLALSNRQQQQQQSNADRQFGLQREQFGQTQQQQERQFNAQREDRAAEQSFRRQSLGIQERATNRREVPTGFELSPEGGFRPVKDGPADPEYIRRANAAKAKAETAKPLSKVEIGELSEKGTAVEDLRRVSGGFNPRYSGWGSQWLGETVGAVTRNTGLGDKDAAAWWQDYDRLKNVTRNSLFGSALTATEKAAFEQADINPGMKPNIIQKNLERQQSAAISAAKKWANVFVQQGRSTEEIEAALGMTVEQLGIKPKAPKGSPAASPQAGPAAAPQGGQGRTGTLPDGRRVIQHPDGRVEILQ